MKPQTKRILLAAPKFCGRGVEYRRLSAAEKDRARENAAEATKLEPGERADDSHDKRYRVAFSREATVAMIRRVTRKDGMTTMDEVVALGPNDWMPIASDDYDKIFGIDSNDDELISAIFQREHSVFPSEVEDILGKALAVSDEG